MIDKAWKDELYKYITGICQTNKHKLVIINTFKITYTFCSATDHINHYQI